MLLAADHGEEFAEHGKFLHEENFDEIARVPLIIRFPHGVYGGRRISELVSTLEIMPTILDVLGIPPNPEVEGRSVMPLIAEGREGRPKHMQCGGAHDAGMSHCKSVTVFSNAVQPSAYALA